MSAPHDATHASGEGAARRSSPQSGDLPGNPRSRELFAERATGHAAPIAERLHAPVRRPAATPRPGRARRPLAPPARASTPRRDRAVLRVGVPALSPPELLAVLSARRAPTGRGAPSVWGFVSGSLLVLAAATGSAAPAPPVV